jgi:predicted nucleic acid-binding protein
MVVKQDANAVCTAAYLNLAKRIKLPLATSDALQSDAAIAESVAVIG